ncbi:MAG: hypothetical protein IKP50_00095 [Bacilli bacterium]|nr:hypothetical protein [Bacilli bacterium]
MELNELINKYYLEKSEYDKLKKVVDSDNAEIKKIMLENKSENTETDKCKASCKIIDKSYFNETKLITILKELGVEGCIKTKEYVDMEELENAIYNNEVDREKLSVALVPKQEVRLTVKLLKEASI